MRARTLEGLDPGRSLRSNAARIVATRLDELRGFAAEAMDPGAAAAQHEMRIAAKRLRYVLEVTGSCFGEEAATARQTVKELQSVLGDIHDCDVMLPRVEGIASLTTLLRARREQLFGDFQGLWRRAADRGVWIALERSL